MTYKPKLESTIDKFVRERIAKHKQEMKDAPHPTDDPEFAVDSEYC